MTLAWHGRERRRKRHTGYDFLMCVIVATVTKVGDFAQNNNYTSMFKACADLLQCQDDLQNQCLFRVLRRDLVNALRKMCLLCDLEQMILRQVNSPGHRSESMQLGIWQLWFDVLEHQSYRLDLAPMNFWVFPELKASLRGLRFDLAD